MSIRYSSLLTRWLLSLFVIAALVGSLPRAALADSWSDARSALQSLDGYLRRHSTGAGWREFLQLAALDAELKKGSAADRAPIYATLGSLNSGAPGLELPKFAPLRKALYQLTLTSRADLPAAFAAAKGQYRPVTETEVQTARKNLEQKLGALQTYLKRFPKEGPGWAEYLQLEKLTAELAKGDQADTNVLFSECLPLYTKGYHGLEMPVFAQTGHALRAYVNALAVKQNPEAAKDFDEHVAQLAEFAKKLADTPGNADTHEFGMMLGDLSAEQQIPEVVTAARRLYSEPNLHFLAKRNIVAAAMQNHIDEVAPLTDNILGTSIRGTSHTQADMFVNLRNNPYRAEFDMNLRGNVYSRTAGFNGPAVVYARGTTAIDGHKLVWLDEYGMHTANNATAAARTSTTYTGFGATRKHFKGIITNVASKRAYQSKGTAERIAASHAADRVENRLDQQAPQMVANANRDMRKNIRAPLDRWGIYPEDIDFSSTTDAVHGKVLAASSYQLGAPYPVNKVDFPGSHDIEIRVHESAINNSAFTALAGWTLTSDYVNEWYKRNKREVPEELKSDDRDWYIEFDEVHPILIAFHKDAQGQDGFDIEIRGTKWKSGAETFDEPMYIKAEYTLVKTPEGGVKAVRKNEKLTLTYPNQEEGKDSARVTNLKTLLSRRFEKIFKKEIVDEGFQLKGRLANYGKLYFRDIASDNGWLQAALGK